MLSTILPSINDGAAPKPEPKLKVYRPGEAPPGRGTSLKLDDERLTFCEQYIKQRIDELREEMGLDARGHPVEGKWIAVRQRHQDHYDNLLEYRKKPGSIFSESNVTTGERKRYVREMTAKITDDLIGTTPFFAAVKRPGDTTDLATTVEEYVQLKADLSSLQPSLKMACRVALIRNEAVVKTSYDTLETPFVGPAEVYVNRDGIPIRTLSGELIYENDDFLPDPNVENLFRLRKDPLFVTKKDQYAVRHFDALPQVLKQRDAVEVTVLDHRSFLCPLRVPCIHKADINVQLFDITETELKEKYGGFEAFATYERRITDENSGESMAREGQGETPDEVASALVRKFKMAECYVRFDADDDGRSEETMFVLNLTNGHAVFWDYLANQMGRRPFEVIPGVEKEPNRWYGIGVLHMMEDTGDYIDSQFNRINVKDSREQSITFRDPNAVKEWKHGQDTIFGTSHVYDVEPGYDKEKRPPIWRSNLQEISETGFALMEKMQQLGNLQFGVISAKDASASNLNNSRTATGILNIERTANVLTKSTEGDMAIGITAVLQQFAETVLENIKEREVFFSRNGEALMNMNRDEIRLLEVSVRLLLTKSRSSETLATSERAILIMKDYRMMMNTDPGGAEMMRDEYIEQLKALEVKDADKKLPVITPEMIQAHAKRMEAAAKAESDANLKAFMAYKDLPESVKRQMEADAGYDPAPPEEIALEKKEEKAAAKAKPAPPKK